jgi:very-short-patch-repair endonuclease
MRVANWRAKEVLTHIYDQAIQNGEEIMDDVVEDAKRRCPVGDTTVPDGYTSANISFTPKTGRNKGQLVEFGTQRRWKGRFPGQLRGTIRRVTRRDRGNIRIYAGNYKVYYACILGGHTYIKMADGFKTICSVKQGDFVIGQDGLPHKVLLNSSFPAKEKPYLIRLTVEYRSGRFHVLTTTRDHKILTCKNGVSFWVKAEELSEGDILFSPKKTAHNRNRGNKVICIECGNEFYGLKKRKYCSRKCRDQHWSKGNNPRLGKKMPVAVGLKIKQRNIDRYRDMPEKHPNRIMAKRGYETEAEKQVRSWIIEAGLKYEKQYKIGKHFADFAIPDKRLLIEADGAYWHKDQQKDIERDRQIMSVLPDWTLIHLHFTERRFSKNINPSPLPNVYYLQCNNSMNSFINQDYFRAVKIVKKEEITYSSPTGAGKEAVLYDLAIEGMHSFIANGIVVSNSFVERGTVKMKAKPFLRPSFHAQKPNILNRIKNG